MIWVELLTKGHGVAKRGQQILWSVLMTGLLALSAPAKAQPYVVFDVQSGRVLTDHLASDPWYPASLTKLMTAYVTFRALSQNELTLASPVRISAHALEQPPAKMGFPVGQSLSLDMALKVMLVKSANDIAMAVGETVGGTESAFVQRMNYEAARLGMTRSHFANPNGLFDASNVTTARDLAVLTQAIITEFPQYLGYFDLPTLKFGAHIIHATNRITERFPGANGMKTGFICQSGFNLVASATRGRRQLVAVVLGESSGAARMETAGRLLERGFSGELPAQDKTIEQLHADGTSAQAAVDMKDAVCGHHQAHSEDEPDAKDIGDTDVSYLKQPFTVRPMLPLILGASRLPADQIVPPPVISTYPLSAAQQKEADRTPPKAKPVKAKRKAAQGKAKAKASVTKKKKHHHAQ